MRWRANSRAAMVASLWALSLGACCLRTVEGESIDTGTGSSGAGTSGASTGGRACGPKSTTGGTTITPCHGAPTYVDDTGAVPHYDAGSVVTRILTGDFNGDCVLDLAVSAQGNGIATPPGGIDVFLGKGDGTFEPPKAALEAVDIATLAAGDFNGDGIPDLAGVVFETCGDDLKVLLGNGDGTFTSKGSYKAGFSCVYSSDVAVGDFDRDGKEDLAVAGLNGLRLLLGNGDGSFRPQNFITGTASVLVVAADFNADGKRDLALVLANGQLAVVLGNGDGTFSAPVVLDSGSVALDWSFAVLAAGDLNGDGFPEVVAATAGPGQQRGVTVFLSNGQGGFQSGVFYSAGAPSAVAIGDINADGHPDLIVGQYGEGPAFDILLGNGDGTFGTAVASSVGPQDDFSVAVGDLRADGHTDLLTGGYGVDVFLYGGCP